MVFNFIISMWGLTCWHCWVPNGSVPADRSEKSPNSGSTTPAECHPPRFLPGETVKLLRTWGWKWMEVWRFQQKMTLIFAGIWDTSNNF